MTVANHLTLNELWRRAKKAKDPIEKDRFLAVYHAKRGLTAKEIARIIPNTPRWVQETVRRYNLEGPEALKDKRHQNPGQKPKLTPEERMRVLEALQGPLPTGACGQAPSSGTGWSGSWGSGSPSTPSTGFCTRWGLPCGCPAPVTGRRTGRRRRPFLIPILCFFARPPVEGVAEGWGILGRTMSIAGLRSVPARVWAPPAGESRGRSRRTGTVVLLCTFVEPETGRA
jgi:hypothetical protein